ncbi:MAG TPA: hypothetical protein VKI00_17215 [Mycobacterium sp.]|uniref:hypothetical protein n=1 Tax=Mycobacterium sp. TaxID=1785 RepID=UPI002CD1DA78|nr:hypothetical protein [Mycobacterium sp.]HME77319.1 hypothetical protein [Mycobacterium sp.]
MQRNPQLWITTGIGLLGAGLIAVTPVATPLPDVQHRQFRLTDYDEFDMSQLVTTTEANWSGLETVLSSSHWLTDPDISQGLSTLFSDLSTNTANPVTNPLSLLTEGALALLSSDDASNAASTALTAVSDNVESALSSGDYSTALTDLEDGPSTVLYAFLNGYPETLGSELISPELGLLTNTVGGAATGQIDALQQLSNTLADELSAVGGGDLTTTPTLLEPGTLDLSVNVSTILNDLAPSGTLSLPVSLDSLLSDAAPSGALSLPVSVDQLLGDVAPSGTLTLPVSLDSLLNGATPGGTLSLPISLDGLLSDAATNGNITVPVTLDQVLGDVLGNGGSISVPPISVDTIVSDLGNPSYTINLGIAKETISLQTFINDLGIGNHTITPPSIPDSTVLSDLESVLGNSGTQDITVSLGDLESLLGSAGSQDISVSTATLEGLLGTSGSSDITLSVSDLQTLLGSAGSQDISLPISTLESLLGAAGSSDISIPLNTLEGLFPSTLSLDLTIPEVTGGAVPNFDVDLGQDLLAVLGSIAPISSDLPSLLGTDPTLDVTSLLSSVVTDLGLPVSITGGDLTLNLSGLASELLAGLVP